MKRRWVPTACLSCLRAGGAGGGGGGGGGGVTRRRPSLCMCRVPCVGLGQRFSFPPPRNLGRVQLRRHFAEMWAPLCDRCRNLGHSYQSNLDFSRSVRVLPPPATCHELAGGRCGAEGAPTSVRDARRQAS